MEALRLTHSAYCDSARQPLSRYCECGAAGWNEAIDEVLALYLQMPEPRQPTMDELRARLPVKGITRHGLYAGPAGTGPEGKTCHDCGWLRYTDPQGHAKHPKCGKTAYTHGDATTIRTSTAACFQFKDVPRAPHPETPR